MSDPVTNVEIEDVLSSIRRLVSTDDREDKSPEPGDESAEERTESAEDNRLVLTPSLRVDNTENAQVDDPDEVAEDAGSDDDWHTAEHADTDHEPVAHDAPEAHASEDHWPGEDSADHQDNEDAQQPDAAAEMSDAQPADDAQSQEDSLRARVAEMEAAVASRQDEWEPDGTTDDAYSGGVVDPLPWEDFQPDETGAADGTADAGGEAELTPDDTPDDTSADSHEETPDFGPADSGELWDVEEAEEAEIVTDDAPSPVEDESDSAPQMADPAPLTDEDSAEPVDDGDDLGTLPEDILDEDALRDLVSEIVREELQGALGERITRNVRKLVRREIHRALAIQDLE